MILKSVPVHVNLSKVRASNIIPVCLGIGSACNTFTSSCTSNGPSGLSNPNGLSGSRLCSCQCGVEKRLSFVYSIGLSILEVWVAGDNMLVKNQGNERRVNVRIHSNPINSLCNSVVRSVDPSSPGINMSNGSSAQSSTGDCLSNLCNIADKVGRVGTIARVGSDTSWGVSV